MSNTVNGPENHCDSENRGDDAGNTVDGPVGRMRLMPSVAFGRRAAALTRVALPVAVLATGFAANGPIGVADAVAMGTTCCPAGGN